ncbi:MAG: GNAT family N-acetyltransferase [Bauldia sp.]|uniref:GNAT family N-acetyltransferase n=1 Tax=Bauldia sp. TaxID=2575872 RepID=UPI001D8E2D46|nr:GNAT family N-acetyltransferase [Bauldia sp.]MCB1494670.1 GNAT family N-acetyltransferase [Bauldia sp.]
MSDTGFSSATLTAGPAQHRRHRPGPEDATASAGPASATARIAAWRDLAGRSADANVFFHPGILLPAIDHLDPAIALATVSDGRGRLIALAPVHHERLGKISPALWVWVHDYAPLGTPLIDGQALAAAADGLIRRLGSGSLVIPDLATRSDTAAALCEAAERAGRPWTIIGEQPRAVLDQTPAGADVRATLPARRRKELARQMRRLAEIGGLTVETALEPDHVRARFEEFLILEAAGWKGEEGTALAAQAATAAFSREIVFNRSERGTTRIVSIRLGDHPVAIVVCFVAGSTAYAWKTAYDEHFARFSPGVQVMLEAADSLLADPAIARIDSCAAPNNAMINQIWQDRMEVGALVIGPVGGGALYRTGLAAFRTEIAARATAKSLWARLATQRHHPGKTPS